MKKQIKEETKLSFKKGGKGYTSTWVHIPANVLKSKLFPFEKDDKLTIEIKNDKLIIEKKRELIDLIKNYNFKDLNLPFLIENKAKENPRKIFLYYRDKKYSFAKINKNSNRLAHGLLNLLESLRIKNAKIAVMLPNCPLFLFLWFGIAKIGRIFIPINIHYSSTILKYILNHSETEILITDSSYVKKLEIIQNELKFIKKIILINTSKEFKPNSLYISIQEILSDKIENPNIKVKHFHKMLRYYYSKSSKKLESFDFTHFYTLSSLIAANKYKDLGFKKNNRIYIPTQLHNISTLLLFVLPAFYLDSSVVIAEKFEIKSFWEEVTKFKVSLFAFSGGILPALISNPASNFDRNHNLKYALGSSVSKDLWRAFENRFGIKIHTLWGRESSVMVTFNKEGSEGGKIGSVGKPIEIFRTRIVNENNKILKPGLNNIGEISMHFSLETFLDEMSPNTKIKSRNERWITFGDLGYIDNEGYLYYVGRKEDLVSKNDKLIYMYEIENIAHQHPYVLESAAFNLIMGNNEEELKICVVLKDKKKITYEEFFSYLQERLAFYKVPRFIEFKKSLRLDIAEEIDKYYLKELSKTDESKKKTWDSRNRSMIIQ